jgi:hypothetical protein
MKSIKILLIFFLICSCAQNESKKMNGQVNNTIEKELIDLGYRSLFRFLHADVDNKIWKSGANQDKLKNIIFKSKGSLLGRFLAAETLRYYKVDLDDTYNEKLGEIYVYALEKSNMDDDDFIGIPANSWGFLYRNDDAGNLGQKLIRYGEIVIPDLIKLLDIQGKVLYIGSQDATIGNSYQYRIKDFAAFYISKIKDIPMTFYQDLEKRDLEIERLKEILENE